MSNLGPQFDPSRMGAEEARTHGRGYRGEYVSPEKQRQRGEQQRFFPVSGADFTVEPHHQTRQQFADDPRTWWHGRYSEQLPKTGGQRNAGIHVGTFGSSDKRRRDLGPSRKMVGGKSKYDPDNKPQPWRSFPVRLRGVAGNQPGEHGYDEGARWSSKRGIYYYENEVEDRGSISALVPSRANLLTHSQAVKEAQQRGLYVHPAIQWEQKQLSRKDYDPRKGDPAHERYERFSANQSSALDQGQLFSTAPYNEGRMERTARRRKTAIDAGVKDYASYAVG